MDLEKEKLELEKKIREEELKIKWKELELKEKDQKKRMVVTPIMATVFAALVGFTANIISTYLTNSNQLEVEKHRLNSSLIINAADTGDEETAAQMLNLFVEVGYLNDPEGKIKNLVESGEIPVIKKTAINTGANLFKAYCAACHGINRDLVGPALAGIEDRAPDKKWIYEFIKNPSSLIDSGDEYANKIFKEYNNTQMTAFPILTDNEIDDILEYIKAETNQ